jgi:hypothetical protein
MATKTENRIAVMELEELLDNDIQEIEITDENLLNEFKGANCPVCKCAGLINYNQDNSMVYIKCPDCNKKYKINLENEKIFMEV